MAETKKAPALPPEKVSLGQEKGRPKSGGDGAAPTAGGKPKGGARRAASAANPVKIRIGIRLKFSVLIGLLVLLVAGGLTTFFILTQIESLQAGQQQTAKRELVILSLNADIAIVEDEPLKLLDAFDLLRKRPIRDILYGAVYNDQRNLFRLEEGEYVDDSRRPVKTQEAESAEFAKYRFEIAAQFPELDTDKKFKRKFTYQPFNAENLKLIREAFAEQPPQAGENTVLSYPVRSVTYQDPFSPYQLTDYYYPIYSQIRRQVIGVSRLTFTNRFIQEEIRQTIEYLILVSGIALVIGLGGAFLLATYIIRPILSVVAGARRVSDGGEDAFKHRVKVTTRDELGLLAATFNAMIEDLDLAQKAKIESTVLDEQIRQAQMIQEGMNPAQFYKKNGVQIKGFTKAAKGVGGDYYDFKALPDGRLAVLISDVSGKSISASLVMVMIKTALTTNFNLLKDAAPNEVIDTINKIMCAEAHIDKFATVFLYIYDPRTGILEFTNGGHGPLFLFRKRLGKCTMTMLEGMPIGIDSDNEYKRARVQLEEGDIVIMETDGIIEAWDKDKNEFGWPRVQQLVLANADKTAKEIVDIIVREVAAFEGDTPAHDDKTMVIMKIPGPGEPGYLQKAVQSAT